MEKQQVFYIHGGEAFLHYEDFLHNLKNEEIYNPTGEASKRWTHSLRDRLGEHFQVFSPEMPNKQNAKYQEWKIWFERHFQFLNDDIILLGWSQGGMFLAKYLSENETPFETKAVFLVAPVYPDGKVVNDTGEDGGDFVYDVKNLTNIPKQTRNITIMHSKDDFVVPYEHALKYKEALPEAELVTFTDKNHFLIEEFPELVERIKQLG